MQIKLKLDSIVSFLWFLLLISKVAANLELNLLISPTAIYYISASALVFLLICLLYKPSKINVAKSYYFWFFLFGMYVLFFGVVFSNREYWELIKINIRISLTFYVIVFLMGAYLAKRNRMMQIIKVTYVTIVTVVILMMLLNIQECRSIPFLIRNIFSGYERVRANFGFVHPNLTGNTALCGILLSAFFNRQNSSKIKLLFIYGLDLLLIYIILATASRSSLVGILLFSILLLYKAIMNSITNKKLRQIIVFLLGIVCLILFFFSTDIKLNDLVLMTNRSGNFYYNIPILIRNNKLWTGLAYIGSGEFMSSSLGTFFVDNYILYTLMSSGLIGMGFNIIFIIVLSKNVLTNQIITKEIADVVKLLLIVNLFISLAETCFMYPSFPSCYILTSLYLAVFAKDKRNYVEESQCG